MYIRKAKNEEDQAEEAEEGYQRPAAWAPEDSKAQEQEPEPEYKGTGPGDRG